MQFDDATEQIVDFGRSCVMPSIPYPMSEQTWDLFMDTLKLWKPRLVAAEKSEG